MIQNEKKDINLEEIQPCNSKCSFCFLNYADVLGNNYLFRNLSATEIGTIIKEITHQVKQYQKGDMIALEGEVYNKLMIIVKGSVVGEMVDFEGKVLRVEHIEAPDTVATAFIFGERNELPVNITALQETKILLIPKIDLLELFKRNHVVQQNFLDIMANRAQQLSRRLRLLGLQSIKGKIAYYLLDISKKQKSDTISLPHTHQELSEMFAVTRPSLSRAIREMNDEGYFHADRKIIHLLDKSSLSELIK